MEAAVLSEEAPLDIMHEDVAKSSDTTDIHAGHNRVSRFSAIVLAGMISCAVNLPALAQFTEIPLPFRDTTRFRVKFVDPMHGWVSSKNGTILRTSDGGANWEKLMSPYPQPLITEVRFYKGGYGVLWADPTRYVSGKLYYTSDGASTWTRVPMSDSTSIGIPGMPDNVLYGYPIHATAPGHIVYLGVKFWTQPSGTGNLRSLMATTSDTGAHWIETYYGLPFSAALTYFWPIDTMRSVLLNAGEGGDMWPQTSRVIKSYNYGLTWCEKVIWDYPTVSIEFTDERRGFVAVNKNIDDAVFFTTYNGGETWEYRNAYINHGGPTGRFINDTLIYTINSWYRLIQWTLLPAGKCDSQWLLQDEVFVSISTCDTNIYMLTRDGRLLHKALNVVSVDMPARPVESFDVQLSPQPAGSYLRLAFDRPASCRRTVDVYSLLGRRIMDTKYVEAGTSDMQITTDGLAPGVYLLRIDEMGRSVVRRFLIGR
jgi:photosystem II stability/assembly factor-like uncharacterized protein